MSGLDGAGRPGGVVPGDEGGPVAGADGLLRCPWALASPMLADYHDHEWGRPVRDERGLFERISLEAFQAGLSWATILAKRPAFRAAFADFAPDVVAAFTDAELEALLQDAGIVRNRAKVEATRTNARATVALRDHGGLERLVWSHDPGPHLPPARVTDLPASTDASTALAEALRRHGFRFVGPTTAYALCQAIGLVDDHLVGCHARRGAAIRSS